MVHKSANQTLPPHPLGQATLGKGGRPRKNPDAYSCRGGSVRFDPRSEHVLEFSSDHPSRNAIRYCRQHRLVAECMLGRLLLDSEVVHHRNGIQWDNRPENLQVLDRSAHGHLHGKEQHIAASLAIDEQKVREALAGRTTLEAAKCLGLNHNTLRRHFDHLLTKRRSPGGQFQPKFVDAVRELAESPLVSAKDAAKSLNTTQWRIRQCCSIHGITWKAKTRGIPTRQ